jgi:hypothetical protein
MITWYVYTYRQWLPLQILNYCIILVCLLFAINYLEESPKFLYNKGRYTEARQTLCKIAMFNGVVFNDSFTFDVEEELSIIKIENERT